MKWIIPKQLNFKNAFADCQRMFKARRVQQVFGLDVGTSAVKIIQLRSDENGYTVTAAGMAAIDVKVTSDRRGESVSKAIQECVQSAGIQTKFAVCGLCGQETVVRNFTLPLLKPEEMTGAVELEAKQVCPFNADDGFVDYQIVSRTEKEVHGYLVVAAGKFLRDRSKSVKDALLRNVLMDMDGLALINCLRYCRENETGPAAILNVGSSCATLAIIGGDNIPFVRDLNYAGKAIVEHLALQNSVTPIMVSGAMKEDGDSSGSDLDIQCNLEEASHKLISNVAETLYYDAVRRKSELVGKIFLCGGFALVDGFADLLKSKLPSETVLWNPFDKIHCAPSAPCADMLRDKGPAFAVAAGLAMRQI